MENHTRAANRQACKLFVMVFMVFCLVIAAVFGMYAVANAVLGKQFIVDCKDQPIENGIVKASECNASGILHCDKGFMLEQTPNVQLACQLIHQSCEVYKVATETTAAVEECDRQFLFVPKAEQGDVMANSHANKHQVQDHIARLLLSSYEMTRGSCVLSSMVQSERLYRERHGPVHGVASSPSAWSGPASAATLLLLSFVSVCALVGSAMAKAAGPDGGGRRVSNDPDTAALLDDTRDDAEDLED